MKYNFDEIIDRRGTGAIKTDISCAGERFSKETLSMWIADMDFACAPPIVEAIKRAADKRIFGYTRYAVPEFTEAMLGFYKRRHNWRIDPAEVVFSCGVVSALEAIVGGLTEPGDGVIIQPPVYAPFARTVSSFHRTLIENPLIKRAAGGYDIDFSDLARKAARDDARLMIVCSPHNPAGRVWREDELRRIYEICHKNGVLLACDEIHCDLMRGDNKHTPIMRLFPDADDIIVSTAPTKTFNIAGLGVSQSFARGEQLRERLKKAVGDSIINPISIAAATAAYSECDEWLDEMNAYVDGNFAFLKERLAALLPEAKMAPAEGTYLAWVDFSAYRKDSMAFESELVEKAALSLEAGARFGSGGEGFMRLCLACPRATIDEAVGRMSALING